MAWEVIFSARTRTDLEQIVSYIAREDPAAAERFGLKLIDQAESLADSPQMGPKLPQKPDARFFPIGPCLIIGCANSSLLALSAENATDALRSTISL
jgi:plasmid stabilization system protein ParE